MTLRTGGRLLGLGCAMFLLAMLPDAHAQGTRDMYSAGAQGYRASIEWRTSVYGSEDSPSLNIFRRTLLKVYAQAGEVILAASSAVGVSGGPDLGDIRIYEPGQVIGTIGGESFSETPAFSCRAQRATPGNGDRGRIASRQQELAGPNAEGGYRPCFFVAPATGIYNIVLTGPAGPNSNAESGLPNLIEAGAEAFGPAQVTSVTAWDVRVAVTPGAKAELPGRLFTYYLAGSTGANGRPTSLQLYAVTRGEYVYKITGSGIDPGAFVFYANRYGFRDADGAPLYHNIVADPNAPVASQDQLTAIQGGVEILPPEYPLFLQPPDPRAIAALGLADENGPPFFSNPTFTEAERDGVLLPGEGGTFELEVSEKRATVYQLLISRRGGLDPEDPENRLLLGLLPPDSDRGILTIEWDGVDNAGRPFPGGQVYRVYVNVPKGEVHFPLLDAENSLQNLQFELRNPLDGRCAPLNGGCYAMFYDGRGYVSANGTLIGTAVGGPLCPDNVGNPPSPLFSDRELGYDSRLGRRGWGFTSGGDGAAICDPAGGYGDKKGLDFWTYYLVKADLLDLRVQRYAAYLPLMRR